MKPNPYEPPVSDIANTDLPEAPSRESLGKVIQAFLAREITAFEFDERLDAHRDSDSPMIQHIVDAVRYHYDDCDDHLVSLSKDQWDYIQRMLLVLASDCRIENRSENRWPRKQLSAAVTLLGILAARDV